MITTIDGIFEAARQNRRGIIAVAAAHDDAVIEAVVAARKAELEKLKKEQGDVIEASIARRKELSKLTLQKADLEAATAELRAIFEEEIKNARNSK